MLSLFNDFVIFLFLRTIIVNVSWARNNILLLCLLQIRTQLGMAETDEKTVGATLACYLAQQGADLNHKNKAGKTPLDVITDPKVEEVVQQFATAK